MACSDSHEQPPLAPDTNNCAMWWQAIKQHLFSPWGEQNNIPPWLCKSKVMGRMQGGVKINEVSPPLSILSCHIRFNGWNAI